MVPGGGARVGKTAEGGGVAEGGKERGQAGKAGEKEPKKIKTFANKKDNLRDKKGNPYALFRIVVPFRVVVLDEGNEEKKAGKKASPSYGRWRATRHF